MKILINVVNARNVGGGLQVVCNFLLGTQKYDRPNIEWYYAVSECLDEVYLDDEFRQKAEGRYFVFPNQPDFKKTYIRVQKGLRQLEKDIAPDVVYTILGPSYNFFKTKEVIRFVNGWVVTANKYSWKTLPSRAKIRMKLHNVLIKYLLRRTNYFITQTETIKKSLVEQVNAKSDNIRVVKNILPEIYTTIDNQHIQTSDDWINIAAIGAGYHKNLDTIPEVLWALDKKHNIKNYRFHITLPENALGLDRIMQRLHELGYENCIVNHGNLKQSKLAELYRMCDFCFLPTVLEVFSASTIEAMFFKLPTVATNLPFNSEVMQDSCLYYTPMNADEAARQFVRLQSDKKLCQDLVKKMQERLSQFSNFEDYFNSTCDFLEEVGRHK